MTIPHKSDHPGHNGRPHLHLRRRSLWLVVVAMLVISITSARAAEFGVYEGGGCDGVTGVADFTRWAGRPPDRILEFSAFGTWQEVEGSLAWGIGCWKAHGHPALTITLPLTTKGIPLDEVAAGRFDDNIARIGRMLVSNGYGDAVLRLGPEMNGNWFPWGNLADGDLGRQARRIATYKLAFAHVVGVLRRVSGAHFLIEWCPGSGQLQVPQADLYPGDDVVDIVGTDLYAVVWGVDHPSAAQVEAALSQGWQLDAVAAFGLQHGKPISFPEWGVGDRPVGNANYGPGDSPEVMAYLIHWFGAHAAPRGRPAKPGEIAYTNYWDYNAGDYNSRVSNGERPRQGAVLKTALAAGTLTGR